MSDNFNPSAFPSRHVEHRGFGATHTSFDPGMSLLDHFAGQAMAAAITHNGMQGHPGDIRDRWNRHD